MIRILAIILVALPRLALALDLEMPGGARLVYEQVTGPDSYAFPTGAFAHGALPVEQVTGHVSRQVFRIDTPGMTSLQLFEPLREKVIAAGLEAVLDCDSEYCGGFDFRFQTEVVPAPDMYVNLTDFRFLSAKRQVESGTEYLSLMVSGSDLSGYVQLIRVSPTKIKPIILTKPIVPQLPVTVQPAIGASQSLEADGFTILSDLTFKVGSATLAQGPFLSLDALALYLNAHPEQRIMLVGHTDADGDLDNNIALSKRRAGAVLDRLVAVHDVDPARLSAEGVGYLSPVSSNLTAQGRDNNRRVEAVLVAAD